MHSKKVKVAFLVLAIIGIMPAASAMHIMEGYLPPAWCVIWGVLCLPFLVMGFLSIKRAVEKNPRALMFIAMAGAFIFVVSAIKMPTPFGSSSHATGTGLGAILFGPAAVSVLAVIVLLFQTLLLAHGGITTLGANTFSMGIAGPFIGFGIYKLLDKMGAPKVVSVFLGAFFADLSTYIVTSFQLAAGYPTGGFTESLLKFLGVFAVTQLPLAAIEAVLTVIIFKGLQVFGKSELDSLHVPMSAGSHTSKAGGLGRRIVYSLIAAAVAVSLVFGLSFIDLDGTDDLAGVAIEEIQPGYEPWFGGVFDFGEDAEVPLFCLQAGLGAALLTFAFFTIKERAGRTRAENGSD